MKHDDVLGDGFETPEQAAEAAGGIAGAGTAIATSFSPDGEFAVVLLPVRDEELELPGLPPGFEESLAESHGDRPQRQVVLCVCRGGRWHYRGASIGNGVGWSSTSYRPWEEKPFKRVGGRNVGVLEYAAPAPAEAQHVLVRWLGADHRVPVSNDWFLFTAWDVSDDWEEESEEPVETGYVRTDGSVVPLSVDLEEEEERAASRELRKALSDEFAGDWPHSLIEAIEPIDILSDDQREVLQGLLVDRPDVSGELSVYWLRNNPRRRPHAVVAPASDDLEPGDAVIAEEWSAAGQAVSFDETSGESSVVELQATTRLVRVERTEW